jgi:hypothetical protein
MQGYATLIEHSDSMGANPSLMVTAATLELASNERLR